MKTKALILALVFGAGISKLTAQEIRKETRGDKEYTIYKVQKGETVFSISKKYGIAPDKFIESNPTTAQVIKLGDIVSIPKKELVNPKLKSPNETDIVYTKHKVAKGQGLMQIARLYNISFDEIKKWNDLEGDKATIVPDQELIVGISTSKNLKKNRETKNNTASNNKSMDRDNIKPAVKKDNTTGKSRGAEETTQQHEVVAGETLFKIAQIYGLEPAEIMNTNSMTTSTVKVGEKLTIVNPKKKPGAKVETPLAGNPATEPIKEVSRGAEEVVAKARPFQVYIIAPGDNLTKIRDVYNVSRTELRYWNGMEYEKGEESVKNQIHAGDSLRIYLPKKLTHVIKKGETIESVKKMYNLGASDTPLEKWNKIPQRKLAEYFKEGNPLIVFKRTGPTVPREYVEGKESPMPSLAMPAHVLQNNVNTVLEKPKQPETKSVVVPPQTKSVVVPPQTKPVVVPQKTPANPYNNGDLSDFMSQPVQPAPKKEEIKEEAKIVPPKEEVKTATVLPKEEPKTVASSEAKELSRVLGDNAYTNPDSPANLSVTPNANKPSIREENGDMIEKGIAELSTNIHSPKPYVATHRDLALVGGTIFVKNLSNGREQLVQIAAQLNSTDVKESTVVQLSQATWDKLGAGSVDKIDVEIKYHKNK